MENNTPRGQTMDTVIVSFYDSEQNDLFGGSFPVSKLDVEFSMNAIPTAQISVFVGTEMNNTTLVDIRKTLENIEQTINTTEVYARIYANIGIIDSSGHTKKSRLELFHGIASGVHHTMYMGISNSQVNLNITLSHPVTRLRQWGLNGYIYGSAKEPPKPAKTIQELKAEYGRAGKQGVMSSADQIAGKVLLDKWNIKGKKNSICELLNYAVELCQQNVENTGSLLRTPLSYSPGDSLDFSYYVTGTVSPRTTGYESELLMKNILSGMVSGIMSTNVLDALGSILRRTDICLCFAPRGLDSITVIPDDGWWTSTKILSLDTSKYSGVTQVIPAYGANTPPDGILVTANKVNFNANGTGDVIYGLYPVPGKDDYGDFSRHRWLPVPAPAWFNTSEIAEWAATNSKSQEQSSNALQDLCNRYAKAVFDKLAWQNSQASVTLGLDAVLHYTCLGCVVHVAGVNVPDFTGRLDTYRLEYMTNGKISNVQVKLGFTHVRTGYRDISSADEPSSVYIMDKSDVPTEFPSEEDIYNSGAYL